MAKFQVHVSKGALHVWSTYITVDADNEEEASRKAEQIAEGAIEGTKDIVWSDDGLTDYNVQSEGVEEIGADA